MPEHIATPRVDFFDAGLKSPKIHIRRPPPGIKHWFEGIEDDTVSMHSEPQGRASTSSMRPTSKTNRDTFLSTSTGATANGPFELAAHGSPLEPRDYVVDSYGYLRQRTNTMGSTPTRDRNVRPFSSRSHSSGATMIGPVRGRSSIPTRHANMPDSINRDQSVLILSETDESDDDELDQEDMFEGTLPGMQYDRTMTNVLYGGPESHIKIDNKLLTVARATQNGGRRLHNVPDLVSTTSIEDGSQYSDDHSPRTSLLSDLRPISFRSEYRPVSFKSEDRPISFQTLDDTEQHAWLTSPSVSQVTPVRDLTRDLSVYLADEYLEKTYPQQNQGRGHSPQPQRVMVVTDEEATLLANMRRQRAEREKRKVSDEIDRRHASLELERRTSPVTVAEEEDSSTPRGSDRIEGVSAPVTDAASEAAPSSPHLPSKPSKSPKSAADVTSVWQDVQHWRKPLQRLSIQKRPSLSSLETAPPFVTSHFSPDSPLSLRSKPSTQHQRTGSAERPRADSNLLPDGSSGHKRRSMSLGDALRQRDSVDVKADVMAAWNDLGGWRRSMLSNYSVVS